MRGAVTCFFVAAAVGATAESTTQETLRVLSAAQNASLLWGTYRPNLYFGTRTRSPTDAVLTGLLWHGAKDFQGDAWHSLRHTCDQGDGLVYAWQKHDGRSFGSQVIQDPLNGLELKTEFIKSPWADGKGGHWALRVSGRPLDPNIQPTVDLVFYVGLDGRGELSNNRGSGEQTPIIKGNTKELGSFLISYSEASSNRSPNSLNLGSIRGQRGEMWKARDFLFRSMTENAQANRDTVEVRTPANLLLAGEPGTDSKNLHFFQRAFTGAFQFDIVFESGRGGSPLSQDLDASLKEASLSFDYRFEKVFLLEQKGFQKKQIDFAKMLLSNLVGGTGYFHGTSVVDRALEGFEESEPVDYLEETSARDIDDEYFGEEAGVGSSTKGRKPNPREEGPFSLFSAVPSRPFFPRGFLWDEGFHQLIISRWDSSLSLEMIKSWADLIDENGWVAREQILGDEARSKVPHEFQTQYPHFANPPTLILALTTFVKRVHGAPVAVENLSGDVDQLISLDNIDFLRDVHTKNPEYLQAFLEKVYLKFKKQYEWFRDTQWGVIDQYGRRKWNITEGYRWRGRKGYHTLTSGLDDYPRSPKPHPGELHVDLISWMGYYAQSLQTIAELIGKTEDASKFSKQYTEILRGLEHHWSPQLKSFCDMTVNQEGESIRIPHKGYMSLFPMFLGLVPPDSDKLGPILDLIENREELWTRHGLASLSQSDANFGTGENYWRGPIWININYLVLRALHQYYMTVPGPHQDRSAKIYQRLRQNIIDTVFSEYERTGFVWEQYSVDGQGKRSHPFTGWTSLVLLIMAESY